MKILIYYISLIMLSVILSCCSKKETVYTPSDPGSLEVIINDIPFKTDKFLRIPFTLKAPEWKKKGFSLRQINVLDDVSKIILATYNTGDFPLIYQDPLPSSKILHQDKIYNYYFSIQLPIWLDETPPVRISNRLVLRDTVNNRDVIIEGGIFTPRYNGTPLVIASPVKGTKWMFINQSTNDYHFYSIFFMGGKFGTGERFAYDNMRVDDNYSKFFEGDPGVNSSYFCYRDTLFAVADGVVVATSDTMTENDGNRHNHLNFKVPIDYAGNYMIINIGNGHYAMYAHCVKGSLKVKPGDEVKEGTPLALLGNSGNSDAPHLHFQVGDTPDFFMCNGLPFVHKKFTKTGDYQNTTPSTPVTYFNVNNEQKIVMEFD